MFGMFPLAFWVLVPENVRQLISLTLSQLACMPGHLDTEASHILLEHMCHICACVTCMPDVMSQGSCIK